METESTEDQKLIVSNNSLKCDKYIKSATTGKCINLLEQDGGAFCKLPTQFRCPLEIQTKTFKMSHSTVQDYITCKRKFWLRHIQGIQVKTHLLPLPLKRGILWDKLQDLHYGACKIADINGWIKKLRMSDMETARIKGLYKAFKECVSPYRYGLIGLQQHFEYHHTDTINGEIFVHGYYDRLYKKWFAECKLTTKPKYYEDPFYIRSQVGTYFGADDSLERVNLEVTLVPAQRYYQAGRNRTSAETPSEFQNRVYEDVMDRPAFYFKGYDRRKKTYGWDFHRSNFNAESMKTRYSQVIREIKERSQRNAWYEEDKSCMLFDKECEFMDICRSYREGVFEVDTDNHYDIRESPLDKGLKEFIEQDKKTGNQTEQEEQS